MPSYRNRGLAQLAIKELEKLGYRRIDKIEHIKDGMDIVFFQKD